MAIVVKWRWTGKYLSRLYMCDGARMADWSHDRKSAIRFESQSDMRSKLAAHFGGPIPWTKKERAIVRLVPRKRHAPHQP